MPPEREVPIVESTITLKGKWHFLSIVHNHRSDELTLANDDAISPATKDALRKAASRDANCGMSRLERPP